MRSCRTVTLPEKTHPPLLRATYSQSSKEMVLKPPHITHFLCAVLSGLVIFRVAYKAKGTSLLSMITHNCLNWVAAEPDSAIGSAGVTLSAPLELQGICTSTKWGMHLAFNIFVCLKGVHYKRINTVITLIINLFPFFSKHKLKIPSTAKTSMSGSLLS